RRLSLADVRRTASNPPNIRSQPTACQLLAIFSCFRSSRVCRPTRTQVRSAVLQPGAISGVFREYRDPPRADQGRPYTRPRPACASLARRNAIEAAPHRRVNLGVRAEVQRTEV